MSLMTLQKHKKVSQNGFKKQLRIIKALNKIDPKHRLVLFTPGLRGNALIRILASHEESWWDRDLMNNGETTTDPLLYPENTASFHTVVPNEFKEWYAAAHTGCMIGIPTIFELIVKKRKNHLDKWWFTFCHPTNIVKDSDSLGSEHITLYASENSKYRNYLTTSPVKNDFAFNVDISMLFSCDREKFYNEYIKILNHFNFTARFTSVRSFILQILDREAYISKFIKNTKYEYLKRGENEN